IGGALLVLFGLQLVGVLRLPLLLREYRWRWRATSVSYVGSAAFGIAFAAGWTPCIGPVLSSILVLASGTQGPGAGAWLLGFYALGLAVPFLLAAVALDRLMGVLSRVRRGLRIAEALAGVVLVVAGGLLFTGTMARLNGLLIRLTPEWLLRWL
ncbi:MAG: cytochrome c biogenesis protein CcdA, partial [Deinococcus sp.]|nr:cytochrome c biogenesis protein CcdA [Deinococcus sp.]